MKNHLILLFIFISVACTRATHAGEPMQSQSQSQASALAFRFEPGVREIEVLGGAFLGFNRTPSEKRPAIDFVSQTLRVGWMLSSPHGQGLLRGNTEFLVGLWGGEIYQGPGSGLAGLSLLLRYNFVQPEARFVPFVGASVGVLCDDVFHQRTQHLVGSAFEFDLGASVGARYLLGKNWAIIAEGGFRHISNAGISSRNFGLNTLGGQIGLSCFFR
ncbi:MAG: acyloxyacyl hydrolase [Verrucomicrobiota bacterium]|nr:acyloxyacyl hydrolase [Verrucomicrobiota bacterium]